MYRIGIDLGGTNIAGGLVTQDGKLLDRETVKTDLPTDLDRIVRDIGFLAETLMARSGLTAADVECIGVGVPCTANKDTGAMEDADHLGFPGGPLVSALEARLPLRVRIENDANAAAWGEYRTGGYEDDSLILVTLGTGIGCGIILNGRLWRGVRFGAGELGHMVIHAGGARCGCGRRGCFEMYGSATALIRRARERMTAEPRTALWRLCGGEPERLEARTVFDGAAQRDGLCLELLDEYTTDLAEGFANMIYLLQPAVLCIGGVSAAGAALLDPVRKKTEERLFDGPSGRRTRIVLAAQNNDAGIIGAALLEN